MIMRSLCLAAGVAALSLFAARPAHAVEWQARHGLTAAQYQTTFNQMAKQKYRLVWVSGYEIRGSERFAAIWQKGDGPAYVARHNLTSKQYQDEFNKLVKQGYRLTVVSGYSVKNAQTGNQWQDRYACIFVKESGPAFVARHGLNSADYQKAFDQYVKQGYRLQLVCGYNVGGVDRYAAIWVKSSGPAWVARHGLTSAQYQAEFNKLVKQGYRLTDVSGYRVSGQDRYAAIFEKSSGPAFVARPGLTASQYQTTFNQMVKQGYRLVLVNGYGVAEQDRYAAIFTK